MYEKIIESLQKKIDAVVKKEIRDCDSDKFAANLKEITEQLHSGEIDKESATRLVLAEAELAQARAFTERNRKQVSFAMSGFYTAERDIYIYAAYLFTK